MIPTFDELINRFQPGNPFAEKAARARLEYIRLSAPSAHDVAMEQSFPLGAGYGRRGGSKRIEQTIDKSMRAVDAHKEAEFRETQAAAYDRGEINAQGRRPAKDADKKAASRQGLLERAAHAHEEVYYSGKERWQVKGSTVADAARQFRGSGRSLVISEHRYVIEEALQRGLPVPQDVLDEYPDLMV